MNRSMIGHEHRIFESGATRDTAEGKYDFEGFLSPLVLCRYAQYMHKHREMADGSMRDSDNWQNGLPKRECLKSAWRHFIDAWIEHRGWYIDEGHIEESLCAIIFNLSAYLHELLKDRGYMPKTGE